MKATYLSNKNHNETVSPLLLIKTVDEGCNGLNEVTLPLTLYRWNADHNGHFKTHIGVNESQFTGLRIFRFIFVSANMPVQLK